MLELYQAEWCPSSHRVRERLTELGVDFVARQVPADREDRETLRRVAGTSTIPALVIARGTAVCGEDAIADYLEARFEEAPGAEPHRRKAAEMRQQGRVSSAKKRRYVRR